MAAHFNLHETMAFGKALEPQNVGNVQVNGEAIVRPWRTGRRIVFVVVAGDMAASDDVTVAFERRRVGTATWDDLVENDGTTQLAFDDEADGGTLENGSIYGEINLETLRASIEGGSTFDYDAIRLTAVNAVAQNVFMAATYAIGNAFKHPTDGAADDGLFLKQRE